MTNARSTIIYSTITLLFIFYSSCTSFFKTYEKKLIRSGDDIAIYELDKNEIFANIPLIAGVNSKAIPDEKKLKLILSSIETGSTIPGQKTIRVFAGPVINRLTPELWKLLFVTENPDRLLYVITKEDDRLAPATRINRNSFYIFWNGKYLNFIFGDAVQNIIFGNHYSFPDWANVPVIDFSSTYFTPVTVKGLAGNWGGFKNSSGKECILSDREIKEEKELKCRWIYFDPDNLKEASATQKPPVPETERKLQELKSLFEKGLISREEYDKKRKETLDKF